MVKFSWLKHYNATVLKARLKIIYTGGTFGMQASEQGLMPGGGLADRLLAQLDKAPGLKTQLDTIDWSLSENVPLLDSANIMPTDWELIANDCFANEQNTAIVIIHGTDTLAYTASALAILLSNFNTPVILTGSQRPLEAENSDALPNLVGAMVATVKTKMGTWVYFNQRLMLAARTVKKNALHNDGFDTPRLFVPASTTTTRISWQKYPVNWANIDVAIFYMAPGVGALQLEAVVESEPQAIILTLYGLGTIADKDTALINTLKKAQENNILLVAISQCYIGSIDFSTYATGAQLEQIGVINGLDTTLESAYTKLMILFRMGYSTDQIKTLFTQSVAGEITQKI